MTSLTMRWLFGGWLFGGADERRSSRAERRASVSASPDAAHIQSTTVDDAARTAEQALITRIRESDEHAFETLFHDYYQPLVRYAYSLIKRADSAEDIVAEVFYSVWRTRASWDPRHGIATYLYGAVRNRAWNASRHERRWHTLLDAQVPVTSRSADADIEVALAAEDRAKLLAAVKEALGALPDSRREIMRLRWEHGMAIPAIAAVMGLSENAVRLQLSRATQFLRALVRAGALGDR